jgi:hypothetical protein
VLRGSTRDISHVLLGYLIHEARRFYRAGVTDFVRVTRTEMKMAPDVGDIPQAAVRNTEKRLISSQLGKWYAKDEIDTMKLIRRLARRNEMRASNIKLEANRNKLLQGMAASRSTKKLNRRETLRLWCTMWWRLGSC